MSISLTGVADAFSIPNVEVDLTHGDFDIFSQQVFDGFRLEAGSRPLFHAKVSGETLFNLYLANLPRGEQRQHHTCNCCKDFFRKYGNLCTVDDFGQVRSALWQEKVAPRRYQKARAALRNAVESSQIGGSFYARETQLGVRRTGFWTHFGVVNPAPYKSVALEPNERAALDLQNVGTLRRALQEFRPDVLRKAKSLITTGKVQRTDKIMPIIDFLLTAHSNGVMQNPNKLFATVRGAPDGWCTPRSSSAGSFLEDLLVYPPQDAVNRLNAKLNPLQYQRPQAPAKTGNIVQANKLFEKMGLEASLDRRFAKLSDVDKIWEPSKTNARSSKSVGAFSSLRQTASPPSLGGRQRMTWSKFERTILPTARSLALQGSTAHRNYAAMTTANRPSAPPLFQWDSPLSWYVYSGGSGPSRWGLPGYGWIQIKAVATGPQKIGTFANNRLLVLEGAVDQNNNSLAIFPELLRSELHGVRSTIEEFSNRGKLKNPVGQKASGLLINDAIRSTVLLVTTDVAQFEVEIDQYD